MIFDDIINEVSDNPYSAFFYTPSIYKKSNSCLFINPVEIIQVYNRNDLDHLLLLTDKFLAKGLIGYCLLEYEAGYLLEDKLEKLLPDNERRLMQFFFFEKSNAKKIKSSKIEFGEINTESFSVSDFKLNTTSNKFFKDIKKIKRYILEGDTYQVNYTIKGKFNFSGSYGSFFKNLLFNQSARYSAFINNDNNFIISLSPELFFQTDNKKIITRPMKGTLSRSGEIKSDLLKALELKNSEKNRAENLMIVDLLRNDLGRICKYGSVKVDELFGIEKYESLYQMVSTIRGKINNGIGLGDIIKNIFPCGSITGAPKIRTMEIIKELEEEERGIYTGSIGIIGKKTSVFNVAIRTLKIDKENCRGEVGLGSGIVWDSKPKNEYQETLLKSEFLTSPVTPFELIETMLIEDGEIFLFENHIDRLKKSAHFFLFNLDEDKLRSLLLRKASKKYSEGKYNLRLTLNKWGNVKNEFSLLSPLPDVIKIIISDQSISSGNSFQYFKTTNRDLYNSELLKYNPEGFFDVIFFNEREELAEGSITNIFVRKGDVWSTPPQSSGILLGIYRNHFILGRNDVKETSLSLDDLLSADEVKLVNSVRGEIKVNRIHYQNEFVEYS
jgi:para-aminobenzoate synthetase/4-amino-4-deoxychorismate lyase